MRCPKCGFISFDNVETCLRCNKDISEVAKAFEGSTLNVPPPVFLKFDNRDDDGDFVLEGDGDEAEIEFADPDLEILVEQDGEQDDPNLEFAFGDEQDDDAAAVAALNEEFGGGEEGAAPAEQTAEGALDLGMFEDTADEETFAFEDTDDAPEPALSAAPAMEIPDELADISDLSPPDRKQAASPASSAESQAAPSLAAEPDDDLDFSSMDLDLDSDGPAVSEDPGPADEPPKARPGSRMDDDLNFDLDLGGLSIHDDK